MKTTNKRSERAGRKMPTSYLDLAQVAQFE